MAHPTARRNFISSIGKLGLATALAQFVPSQENETLNEVFSADPEAGHVFLANPYLQAPQPDSMTIMWITNELCHSWVEYGEAGQLNHKAQEGCNGLVNAWNRVNKITLKGLKPGTKYGYKVHSKQIKEFQPYKVTYGETITSELKYFTTPPTNAETASWLVLNDIHDRPGSFQELLQLNGTAPYDYIFLNGDMFDYQTDEAQFIRHLLAPCTNAFAGEKPFLFVRGNHETRGRFARNIADYYANPGHTQYFSYKQGPVFNIVLDTGEDKPDTHPVYAGIVDFDAYRREQTLWLENQLRSKAARKAKYRVVMMHIPPLYSDEEHGTLQCRELFLPLFNKYKVDLLICGHTHQFGMHPAVKGKHDFPIIIGGGPKTGNRTLLRVDAGPRQLKAQMWKDDGSKIGEFVVNG